MSKRYINKEKVNLLKKYKKKEFNSDIEYNRFLEEINSMIDEYVRVAGQTISDNNITRIAARLGTFSEVLTDAVTYNTLVVSDCICHLNEKCNARDIIEVYKKIIDLRDHTVHFSMYNPNIDNNITADMINKDLLTHKFDSIYVDRWAMSSIYDDKLDIMINTIPCGTRIYFLNDNDVINEAMCMRRAYM